MSPRYGSTPEDHEPDSWGMCRICEAPGPVVNAWQWDVMGPCPGYRRAMARQGKQEAAAACQDCGHDHQHRACCTYNVGPDEPCGCEARP